MTTSAPPVAAAYAAYQGSSRERKPLSELADWIETYAARYGPLLLTQSFGLPLDQTGESCKTNDEKITEMVSLLREAATENGIFNQSKRDYLGRVLRVWSADRGING